jgi:ribonuclease III
LSHSDDLDAIQTILGYRFRDLDLLKSSLTHASIAENRLASNERLEFLGDAVLGIVICEELYQRYPQFLEGDMTRIKSVVVSRETCSLVADRLDIVRYLSLGKGITEAASLPASLAACAYEAVTGAIYLDGGLEPARRFILAHMGEEIDRVFAGEHRLNYKSLLQQHAQRDLGAAPNYEVLDEKGPDHAKAFEIAVTVRGRRYPSAWGPSKKAAEQRAAMEALRVLGHLEEDTEPIETDAPADETPPRSAEDASAEDTSHHDLDREPQTYEPDDNL